MYDPQREAAIRVVANWLKPTLQEQAVIEADWRTWLTTLFESWVSSYGEPDERGNAHKSVRFGHHQEQLWDWVWSLRPGVKPHPFVASWPRGGAKSTSAELAVAALAARNIRRYALYISATQEQADDHIQNISALFESTKFSEHYPATSTRDLNKYGSSKGWRRNRLRTASGFTADAIGLDTAARGVKLEDARPDLVIFDDIDEELDGPAATEKKILVLTRKLLPAGSSDTAVLAIQNLIIPDGIFARLCNIQGVDPADFLQDRVVSGPFPAVFDAVVIKEAGKYRLIGGRPLWQGQNLRKCQQQINEWGYSAWLVEAQQEVNNSEGGLFAKIDFPSITIPFYELPPDNEMLRTVVWVDPAVTSTDKSDSHGIQVDSLGTNGIIYRRRSWEGRATPAESLKRAFLWAVELHAEHIGVETDQGGDVWELAYNAVWDKLVADGDVNKDAIKPNFVSEKAGSGYGPKSARAARMLVDYEQNRFRHVADDTMSNQVLERALGRFPNRKPYDLTDAAFWAWHDLKEGTEVGRGAAFDPPIRTRGVPTPPPVDGTPHTQQNVSIGGRLWQGHGRPLFHKEQSKGLFHEN